jgi:predicted SAM-dependent methyltransferase
MPLLEDLDRLNMKKLKLNLGCGNRREVGYINVDKFGSPDVKHDLEKFPWPWKKSSVKEILLIHVLEHLGKKTDTFLAIMKELYRISSPEALIKIRVPHPRSDSYLIDPTHVRPILPDTMAMFSKKMNKRYKKEGWATTPLADYIDVDFEIVSSTFLLNPQWDKKYKNNQITTEELEFAVKSYNNVVEEVDLVLKVVK